MAVVFPAGVNPSAPVGDEAAQSDAPIGALPEQVRVVIHVGTWFVEVSLTANTPLAMMMDDLVPFLIKTLSDEGHSVSLPPTGVFSLAPEGGAPFVRSQTLSGLGVVDGTRLVLRPIYSTERIQAGNRGCRRRDRRVQ